MLETTTHRWSIVVMVIGVLMVVETIAFFLAALLHLGIQFPLGFSEPRIIPAVIVEGLCGVFLAVGTYGVFVRKTWAWGGSYRRPHLRGGGRPAGDHYACIGPWPQH